MRRVYDGLGRIEAVVAGFCLLSMVALIFLGGVARMLHHPLNWTTDLATCLFAWGCFFCADVAWRRDAMMSIELLTARLSPAWRHRAQLLNHAIIAAFLLYLVGSGLWLSWISRTRSFQGIPEISYSWVTMSLPVGGLLLLATCWVKASALVARRGAAHPPAERGGC
ncbi:MAG: TRAP transporter small permease subunit [Alphaproteobacteria bacterium]|nr:TRAP transporter small permease subunit [Alphaproteobacteria bacterium]